MPFLSASQRSLLRAVAGLGYCNPFLPERVKWERVALGAEFVEGEAVWSYRIDRPQPRENVGRILAKLEPVAEQLRARLAQSAGAREPDLVPATRSPALQGDQSAGAREPDLVLYEDAILYLLY